MSTEINIIPQPQKVVRKSGCFSFSAGFRIAVPEAFEEIMFKFSNLWKIHLDISTKMVSDKANFIVSKKESLNEEAYEIKIETDSLEIYFSSYKGLVYSLQTLSQMLLLSREQTLPNVFIQDEPYFQWRGIHLDESRHFFGKKFVKKLLNLAAFYKLNRFHWHLTDDNGWRIEIKQFPKLHEIASKRLNREHLPWKERDFPPQKDETKYYSGFYSQKDINEIIRYAAAKNITIIPEIEMPGHCRAVFSAYPEFSCTGEKRTVAAGINSQYRDVYCAGNEKTYHFLSKILEEISSLFPGKYIHLGGDEVNPYNWNHCQKCQVVMKEHKMKNWPELQYYFMRKIIRKAIEFGKIPIVWDEMLDYGKLENTLVMIWRGNGKKSLQTAKEKNNQVIMCPNDTLYFDWKQEFSADAKGAFGVTPLSKIYNYQIPSTFSANVIGLQGNIWTEFMPNPERVEYMITPRICALAENGWCHPDKKDWELFKTKVFSQEEIFKYFTLNYFRDPLIWNE
jgi:hexosaminidase